jgi:Ca2+:H+ antiporter
VRFAEQTIKATAAQLNASLLLIAVIAVLIPSAFHFSITTSETGEGLTLTSAEEGNDLLAMSHGVAVLLLVLYLGYLIFQMWSHAVGFF